MPQSNGPRPVPRAFELHWGGGSIIEEATADCEHHEPTIQLLKFADGSRSLRFCYYHNGRFQRGPLILSADDIVALREQVRQMPGIRALLAELVSD